MRWPSINNAADNNEWIKQDFESTGVITNVLANMLDADWSLAIGASANNAARMRESEWTKRL